MNMQKEKEKMEALAARSSKNKAPAALQITAEQILREAKDRQEIPKPKTALRIADQDELLDYQLGKRKGFEDAVRRNRYGYHEQFILDLITQ